MKPCILITGIGQRLGLATAKHFLNLGFHVYGTYRTEKKGVTELRSLGATLFQADFNDTTHVDRLITNITECTPTLRAIIHNASDWATELGSESPNCLFDSMMAVHAKAPYLINLSLAALLKNSSGTTDIIHVSDAKTAKGSSKHIAYIASKAALDNLTLSFAAKLAPSVKVNTIAPSLICFNDDDDPTYRANAVAKALIPREGGIEEFISAIDYLINSQYITGRTITLDGGRHLK